MHIRRARVLFAAASLGFVATMAAGQDNEVKVIAYNVHASISAVGQVLGVSLICELQKANTASHIDFLFDSDAQVQSIQSRTEQEWSDLPFTFAGKDTVRLTLPVRLRSATTLAVRFIYKLPNAILNDTLLALDRGNRWYPLMVDQIASMKLTAEVPARYTVLSAGNLMESVTSDGRARFVWQCVAPVFKLPLIIFRSDVFTKSVQDCAGKTVVLYSFRNDTLGVKRILAEAGNAFMFYKEYVGEYPYAGLTLVEVPHFEGINVGSGLLTVGSRSLDEMNEGYFDGLHLTIAQQWMGAGVFAQFGKPGFWFLSLSFAHYLRLMYVRHARGEEAFNEALRGPLKKYPEFAGKDNDIPIIGVDFPNSKEKGLLLYAKGPFVISKLHKQMGEESWRTFLQYLYRNFAGKILTYDEFRSSLSKHDASGRTLLLLNRLMTQKGIPEE